MKKKKTKKQYFTKEHQDAIVEYSRTDSKERKNVLYRDFIGPVFEEMISKIVYTYKFTSLSNLDEMKYECLIYLIEILHKFDPDKGYKAFSYFTVVTINWFIGKIKKENKRNRIEVSYDYVLSNSGDSKLNPGSINAPNDIPEIGEDLISRNTYEEDRNKKEFLEALMNKIDEWVLELNSKRENEKKILLSSKILFNSIDDIDVLYKKIIHAYIRNITGLNSKQVISNKSRIRKKYAEFVKDWNNGN